MSVFAGEIHLETPLRADAPDWLGALDFVVAERAAQWSEAHARLVTKRLVVDDRDRTAPLLMPAASGVVVAVDGHLFNPEELASALALPRDASDETLLAAAWEKWGDECVARCNGEFALAAWDARQRRLLLAVDHVATVPLYWTRASDGRYVFSTELGAVAAAAGVRLEPDWERIADYLAGSEQALAHTFYRGIHAVPRGCAVVIAPSGVREVQHWTYAAGAAARWRNPDEAVAAARQALERAVKVRLATAAGTAAHLTGGLDSSAVAAVAARAQAARGRELPLFSIVPWWPSERAGGDGDYIPAFLRTYPACPHRYVIGELGSAYDLPGLPNGPLNFQLTSAIRQVNQLALGAGCKVMLNGWGGEAGATYPGFGAARAGWRRGEWAWLAREGWAQPSWRRRAGWMRELIFDPGVAPFDRGSRLMWPLLREVLRPEFLAERKIEPRCLARRSESGDPLIDGLARSLAGILRQGRLESWRFQSRAEGFRYRYPLLDRQFLEVVRTLPASVFIARGRTRELVRSMLVEWWPAEIRERTSKIAPMVAVPPGAAREAVRRAIPPDAPIWTILRIWPADDLPGSAGGSHWRQKVVSMTAYNLLEMDKFLRFAAHPNASRKHL